MDGYREQGAVVRPLFYCKGYCGQVAKKDRPRGANNRPRSAKKRVGCNRKARWGRIAKVGYKRKGIRWGQNAKKPLVRLIFDRREVF